MLTHEPWPLDRPHLKRKSDAESACELLRRADALIATAVEMLGRCDVEAEAGMPAEMMLGLDARRTMADARMLAAASAELKRMPKLAAAFAAGVVSWSQMRAILLSSRSVPAAQRAAFDERVASWACRLTDADPDRLVQIADDEAARLRPDLARAREDRMVDREFLMIQGRIDGGASIYGEAGPEAAATLVEALDACADAPQNPEHDDARSRAAQRFDALINLCEASLAGADAPTRPRPRLIATVDISEAGRDDAMRVLWGLAGRPARLSAVSAATLSCDATVVPVIFDGAQPIAVGDAAAQISGKVRTALVARDGGCRFPGCRAPAAWADAHHLVPGRGRQVTDLVLLCRRCHRRVHRFKWKIRLRADGSITFTARGRTHTSHPRHRSLPAIE